MRPRLAHLRFEPLEDRTTPFIYNGIDYLAFLSNPVTAPLVVDDQRVWWGEGDNIRGVLNDDQSTIRSLGAPGVRDFVYANGFLYFVDGSSVWKLDRDSGIRTTLTSEFGDPTNGLGGNPSYIAVGSGASPALFVTTGSTLDRAIYQVNRLAPGAPTRTPIPYLAEDITAGNVGVAWTAPSRGAVDEFPPPGIAGAAQVVYDAANNGGPTGGNGPQTIASDYTGNLFWVEGSGAVREARGGSVLTLASGSGGAHGSGLAVDNGGDGYVYFVNGNSIQYVPKGGDPSRVVTLVSNIQPVFLAVDSNYVYWSDTTIASPSTVGRIERVPKPQASYLFPPPSLNPNPANKATAAYGADAGSEPRVRVIANGQEALNFLAFDQSFTGGVRVAVADVNGDGVPDIIAAPGPGGPSVVRVFDGKSGSLLSEFPVFEGSFTGGFFVAAGDFKGDGKAAIVIAPDQGGGGRVQILDPSTGAQVASFNGIADDSFRGGVRVAVGDVNGDGVPDLIVAAGFGGGPRVAVFDGTTLFNGNPQRLFNDFFVFEQTLRNGVYIAAGDVDGDGFADIIAGGGPGGGPRVLVLSGRDLLRSGGVTQTALLNYFAGDSSLRGGVRVAAGYASGDRKAAVFAVAGPPGPPQATVASLSSVDPLDNFLAFGSGSGAFVAAR
jgi:hypothetical protein